ncbi:MAG: hypothetical protein ACJ762_16750 [Solirubrobacteraceae bacterium]
MHDRIRNALLGLAAGGALAAGGTALADAATTDSSPATGTSGTAAPAQVDTAAQPRDRDGDGKLCPEDGAGDATQQQEAPATPTTTSPDV